MYRNLIILLAFFFCATFLTVPQARAQKAHFDSACSVLVVGDSLSIPLGQRLEEYFTLRPGIEFHRLGKVSSGLARPDFFDWEANLRMMARRHTPDVVFIMIGTNDTKNVTTPAGRKRIFGQPGWQKEYQRRAQRLLNICRAANPHVSLFWVGAPVMGRLQLDKDVRVVNQALARLCQRTANCAYIDTRAVLADRRGRFISHTTDENGASVRLRAKDGVHLTRAGSLLLADRCLEQAIVPQTPVRTAKRAPQPKPKQPQQTAQAPRVEAAATLPHKSGWIYSIQESSWAQYDQAVRRVRKLQKRGIAARVAKTDLGTRGVWHRVMIGSFRSLRRAKKEKQTLHAIYKLNHALIMKLRNAA